MSELKQRKGKPAAEERIAADGNAEPTAPMKEEDAAAKKKLLAAAKAKQVTAESGGSLRALGGLFLIVAVR